MAVDDNGFRFGFDREAFVARGVAASAALDALTTTGPVQVTTRHGSRYPVVADPSTRTVAVSRDFSGRIADLFRHPARQRSGAELSAVRDDLRS